MTREDAPRHPWLLGLTLGLVTAVVVVLLATSSESGTGSEDVGERGSVEATAPIETPAPATGDGRAAPVRNCAATQSNPGGTNNYIPDAREQESLGDGFVIEGFVRQSLRCEALEDVKVQVWLATETGGEQDNRATVRTDGDGRYRIQTPPTVPQFGEPNIHVAVDGDRRFEPVFIRRVVDLDDKRAVVNLTLRQR